MNKGFMKYQLPQPFMTEELAQIVSREVKRQKLEVLRMAKRQLKQLADVLSAIRKKGLASYLVRRKLPGNLGYGIFLHPKAKPLLKGQVIGPYSGNIELVLQHEPDDSAYAFSPIDRMHLTREEQAVLDSAHRFHPGRQYALNVNAERSGNFTRFINHSAKPNVVAELFKIPKNEFGVSSTPIEVIYLVKKTILPGEQLLINYEGEENSYWHALGIKPDPVTPRTFRLSDALTVVKQAHRRADG
jgi:hypothetical protein